MTSSTVTSIDEYIASFPSDIQLMLKSIRQVIRQVAPEAKETIKYGIPTYVLNGNLVYFGAYKKHIGLFGIPNNHESFRSRTAAYRSGRGSIQFPLDQPMPLDLIKSMVEFRAAENRSKSKK